MARLMIHFGLLEVKRTWATLEEQVQLSEETVALLDHYSMLGVAWMCWAQDELIRY